MRASKFAIWKGTSPVGVPPSPVLLAVSATVAEGQNHAELEPEQAGSTPEEGGAKNRPFEPVSRKECEKAFPWRLVSKVPVVVLTGNAVAPVRALLGWVPIPR